MDEAPGGVVMALRASTSAQPPQPSRPAADALAAAATTTAATAATVWIRQRFSVELRAGETTIVSWKKLQKDGSRGSSAATASSSNPKLESQIAPPAVAADHPMEPEQTDAQPAPNRFSAVIEKIERLYMGKESSDEEELDGIPDDDQYDTEDSFIDDTELNDYFQVDKSTTKHQGFFINRGKLEHMELSSSPNLAPKKRRRKDAMNAARENDVGSRPTEFVDVSNMKMKNAARHAPLVGKSLGSSSIPTLHGDHQDGKHRKNKASSMDVGVPKKIEPSVANTEVASSPKLPNRELALPVDMKDNNEQKVSAVQTRDVVKVKESMDSTQDMFHEKGPPSKAENDRVSSTKVQVREKNGFVELPDLNIPGNMYPTQTMVDSTQVKEAPVRPKGPILERAIHDLEKMVATFKPPEQDIQYADTSQGVKKRLPMEIKQKLAKVARLANGQGKIASEEFLGRLMGILGHLVQQKTLKRHLKEMVELSLLAKQEKADRFQKIKKEVIEMIKTRIAANQSRMGEHQTGSTDDFQDSYSEKAFKAKMSMDDGIEDKICDLYDLYVEGMDEDKGPQMRKLYGELAELWPAGYVDSSGIKDAINRAKGRKRALYKQKIQDEKMKRKRLSSAAGLEDDARTNYQPRAGQQRPYDAALPPINGSSGHYASKHQDKPRSKSSSSIATDETSKAIVAMKKVKKSLDGVSMVHAHVTKFPSHMNKDGSFKQMQSATDDHGK